MGSRDCSAPGADKANGNPCNYHDLYPVTMTIHTCTQDEKALYDAAQRGDVSTVRRLIASHVNVDCIPYEVCVIQNCVSWCIL